MSKYHLPRTESGLLSYSNKYGQLELGLTETPQHISTVSRKSIPEDWKFNTETAEQIALITDNRHMQLVPPWPVKDEGWYLCVHESSSMVYLAKVVSISYKGGNPMGEITAARTDKYHQYA